MLKYIIEASIRQRFMVLIIAIMITVWGVQELRKTPLDALPEWLQVVATVNPLTYAIDASRHLALAAPVGTGVLSAAGTSGLLLFLGAAAAMRGFRRPL